MLNKNQKEAIKQTSSPLIVIAGPGTGKTTLIVEKIKYLINTNKLEELNNKTNFSTKSNKIKSNKPIKYNQIKQTKTKIFNQDNILAITFTRKAAREMSERVEAETNSPFLAKTFHEFALDIIEKYQKEIPHIDKNFKIIPESEQLLFFIENIENFNLSSIEVKNNSNFIAYELQSTISKLKDFGIKLKDLEKLQISDFNMKMDIFMAYSKYELYKKENNFLDFADLLQYLKDLLKNNQKTREEIQNKYKYILVDEFQDTNQLQLDIITLLAKNNITIVGDQKQAIYGFRGANFTNLDNFKKNFPNYTQIYLDENYRCSKEIISLINQTIEDKNEHLKPNIKKQGKNTLIEATNENSQFNYIAKKILKIKETQQETQTQQEIQQKNKSKSSQPQQNSQSQLKTKKTIGILFRRKAELKQVARKLKNIGIEFNSNETENLFDFEIVKDILSILKITINPRRANNEIFKLLIDEGVSHIIVKNISRKATFNEKSIYNVLKKEDFKDDIYKNDRDLILNTIKKIDKSILLKNSKLSIFGLIREIIFKFNYYKYAILAKNNDTINVINNFLEFTQNYANLHRNNDLERFLKICNYSKKLEVGIIENQNSKNLSRLTQNNLTIELLTIHASKGKEYDFLILPYINERRFPTSFKRSKFDILEKDNKEDFLNEEKRLFFVAISRAKQELDIIYVKRFGDNKTDSKPSKFLNKLKFTNQIIKYDKEYSELEKSDIKDEIREEIMSKIKKYILNDEFEKAKQEIDILSDIYGKKTKLDFFINNNNNNKKQNPQKQYYIDKINKENQKSSLIENVEIDANKMIYSVSQIKTYQSCPKKYLFSYIYKIPSISRHYFDFGTSMHTVFETLLKDIENFDQTKHESTEILFLKGASILSKEWISLGYENVKQEKEYYEKGLKAIKDFIKTQLELQKSNKNRKTISNEKKFIIEVEGKKILGFIDRIDKIGEKEYEIIDYKTSNSTETQEQLKNNLQLYVYAMALKHDKEINKLPQKVGLWYLIHNKIVSVDIKDIDKDKLKKEIMNSIYGIESNTFSPTPSYFDCTYCDYSSICGDSQKKR